MKRVARKSNQTVGLLRGGPGRPKGCLNKTTKLLKHAIITAAERVGEDGQGREGLIGYLMRLAKTEEKAFAMLLGKVLPLQITGDDGVPLKSDNLQDMTQKELVAAYMEHLQKFNAPQQGQKSTRH